jgi:hypothetical protein
VHLIVDRSFVWRVPVRRNRRKQNEQFLDKVVPTLVFASSLGLGTGRAQVTGCLVKGDEPKEVWLAQKDGRIYGLESSKIELNAHLGHKVIVRGYVLPEGKEEAGEARKLDSPAQHTGIDQRVNQLGAVSGGGGRRSHCPQNKPRIRIVHTPGGSGAWVASGWDS